MIPKKCLKMLNLINFEPLWAWQNLWGYGRKVHAPNLFLFLFTCNSVYAICALRSAWDADELVQAETMARQAEIELRELLRRELIGDSDTAEEGGLDSSDKSYWTTLGLRMLENLQVHVTNVHVRFDGASEGHQFRSVAIGK